MKSKEEVVQEFRIQSLQEATMRVITRKGMTGVTVQDIADEAGVAKGTIYLYFRDRDELVERTFEDAIARLMQQIDAVLDQDRPFDEMIRAVIAAKFAFFRTNREFFRMYISLRLAEGATRPKHRKQDCHPQYRLRAERLAGVLKRAMDRGEIITADPYRLAVFIIEGSTAVLLERLTEDTSPDESEDVEFVAGLVLDGVRKRSGS